MKWLEAFTFTQIVELPFWFLAFRIGPRRTGPGAEVAERPTRTMAILLGLGASALTHPFVWFAFPQLGKTLGYWPMIALAEAFAVGVEAAYARAEGVRWAIGWSLAANAASFGLGVLILWPWWRSG